MERLRTHGGVRSGRCRVTQRRAGLHDQLVGTARGRSKPEVLVEAVGSVIDGIDHDHPATADLEGRLECGHEQFAASTASLLRAKECQPG